MKRSVFYMIFFCLGFSTMAAGQIDGVKSTISTIGRYKNNAIELRWIPDNKTILRLGLDSGFIIQRTDSGMNKYVTVATIKASDKSTWEQFIVTETDTTTRDNLELAMDFLFTDKKLQKTTASLTESMAMLNEQKAAEDMIYAVFVMTAIKESKVAKALGLGWVDSNVQSGKTYTYRIILKGKSPVYTIVNGMVNIKAAIEPHQYKNEVFVYAGDKELSFAWPDNSRLAGYYVERASEGENSFKPLNTTPFYTATNPGFEGPVNGSFKDDSLTNYKWYRYRFYGITAFGEKVLFAEVKGMPKDLTPPNAPSLTLPKHSKPNEVTLAWEVSGNISDLKGFIVGRSNRDSGDFKIIHTKLLPNKTRNYIDTGFSKEDKNYYVVYALDTAGNISGSYPAYVAITDSTPPAKPVVLSAVIDSLGVVVIKVNPGKEKDLKGYRLFKSNGIDHEFSVIDESFKTAYADTTSFKWVFTDTVGLNSLTPNIYYQVKALDFNYNQSVFSDKIKVKRPDTIPPITPVIFNVVVKERQIELYFSPSESSDVKEHIIYRKTDLTAKEWEPVAVVKSQKSFTDTSVQTGITYYYSIRAKDEGNLYSGYAGSVYGKPYDSGIRPAPSDISTRLSNKQIIISWQYSSLLKDAVFVIYKKNQKGEMVPYAKVKELSFTDKNVWKDNQYAIKVITSDGGQSKLSMVFSQAGAE